MCVPSPTDPPIHQENIDGADVLLNRSIRKALRQWNKGPVYQLDDEYFTARTSKRAQGLLSVGNYRNLRTYSLRRVSPTDPDDLQYVHACMHVHVHMYRSARCVFSVWRARVWCAYFA